MSGRKDSFVSEDSLGNLQEMPAAESKSRETLLAGQGGRGDEIPINPFVRLDRWARSVCDAELACLTERIPEHPLMTDDRRTLLMNEGEEHCKAASQYAVDKRVPFSDLDPKLHAAGAAVRHLMDEDWWRWSHADPIAAHEELLRRFETCREAHGAVRRLAITYRACPHLVPLCQTDAIGNPVPPTWEELRDRLTARLATIQREVRLTAYSSGAQKIANQPEEPRAASDSAMADQKNEAEIGRDQTAEGDTGIVTSPAGIGTSVNTALQMALPSLDQNFEHLSEVEVFERWLELLQSGKRPSSRADVFQWGVEKRDWLQRFRSVNHFAPASRNTKCGRLAIAVSHLCCEFCPSVLKQLSDVPLNQPVTYAETMANLGLLIDGCRTSLHEAAIGQPSDAETVDKEPARPAPSREDQTTEYRLHIDDIDNFSQVRSVPPSAVAQFLHDGTIDISEDLIKLAIEAILHLPFHHNDRPNELNDIYTANVTVKGSRRPTAFMLKGPGIRKKEMAIADCGKNGDQLVRLFDTPADLFIVQFVGRISEMVVKDIEGKIAAHRERGKKAQFVIMDGQDTARFLFAYGRLPK